MKIPYKENFDPSEIPDGVIAIPFKYGPSYNGLINGIKCYTKEQYLDALEDERLVELYSTGTLGVEYVQQGTFGSNGSIERFQTIDPKNVIGSVFALDDNYLFIKKGSKFDDIISDDIFPYLKVYMRSIRDKEVDLFRIIAWDVYDSRVDDRNEKIASMFDEFASLVAEIYFNKDQTREIEYFKKEMSDHFIKEFIYSSNSIELMVEGARLHNKQIRTASNSCEAMYMDN